MRDLIKSKKTTFLYILLIIFCLGIVIFTFNNYKFYEDNIAKIINVEEKVLETTTITYGFKDIEYEQIIEAKILNGEDKDKIIKIKNTYFKSNTYEQKYKKNDEIFISLNKKDGKITSAHIEGYKRDKYVVLITMLFILTIVFIGKSKGFFAVISVLLNLAIFYLAIHLNNQGFSLSVLSFIIAIIFCIISLLLVSGFNKKTLSAILSSITGVTITTIIALVVIYFTDYSGIRFEQIELLTRPYEEIIISEIIIGGLGAIMDISITISSSLNELIVQNDKISLKALKKSGIEIGKDVTGTMINVLFFTYICGVLPNLTILFRNGLKVGDLLHEYITIEMTRALTGAIGIVITIPISIIITTTLYKRRIKSWLQFYQSFFFFF